MNKKLAAALSGGAVLMTALTGCGSDGGGPDPKLGVWAKKVCDAVPAQYTKIKTANADIAKIASDSDLQPQAAKQTYAQAFQDMSDGYKAIATAINGAGAPPGVDGGAKRQQDAVTNLNSLATSYANLKKKVDGLDTKDQGKFAKGLHEVADQTKEIGRQSNSGTEALKRLEQGDVKEAIAEQQSCKVSASAPAAKS